MDGFWQPLFLILVVSGLGGYLKGREVSRLTGKWKWRKTSIASLISTFIWLIFDFVALEKFSEIRTSRSLSSMDNKLFLEAVQFQELGLFFLFIATVCAAINFYRNMKVMESAMINIKGNSYISVDGAAYESIFQTGRDANITSRVRIKSSVSPEVLSALETLRAQAERVSGPDGTRLEEAAAKALEEAKKPTSNDDSVSNYLSRVVVLAERLSTLSGPVKAALDLLKCRIV